jgi:hypothetical protein
MALLEKQKQKKIYEQNDRWMKDKTQLTDECIALYTHIKLLLIG